MLPRSRQMITSNMRFQAIIRALTDLVIVNVSVLGALLAEILFHHMGPGRLARMLWPAACMLSAASPPVFFLMGFYTKGRSYTGKYKALIIIQATGIVFGIVGFGLYFLRLREAFPRSAF